MTTGELILKLQALDPEGARLVRMESGDLPGLREKFHIKESLMEHLAGIDVIRRPCEPDAAVLIICSGSGPPPPLPPNFTTEQFVGILEKLSETPLVLKSKR